MMLLKLAFRNLVRNSRRTLLTSATVLIATALVAVSLAWIEGIFDDMIRLYTVQVGHLRVVKPEYAAREQMAPLYENLPDAAAVQAAVMKVPGVRGAEPRILTGAVISVGDTIGDNFCAVVAASDAYYKTWLQGPDKIVSGTWLTGAPRETVLGRTLARDLGAQVGGEVLLLSQTQYGSMSPTTARVVGIVAGDGMLESQAFLPLEEGQWLLDLPGGALEILVWGDADTDAALLPLQTALQAEPRLEGLRVQRWSERSPWNTMVPMMDAIKAWIGMIIVFIAALAIFNTMTMSVMERTSEVGVLRAMGMGRLHAVAMFVVEALCIGFLGGLGGMVFGGSGAWYLEKHGMTFGQELVDKVGDQFPMQATFYAHLSANVLVWTLIMGLLIAVAGAFLPSLRAASIQPVTAMRSRR